VYCTDEHVALRATGDFGILAPAFQQLASGNDGVFEPNVPWVLNSATNFFQSQGVGAQNVVWLTKPQRLYPGSGLFFAVDSASGNSITLRQLGQPLSIGMPPSPLEGVTSVEFVIRTLYPQIEEASYILKDRYMINEAIQWRSSFWQYKGVEDDYRVLRRACVLHVLADRYLAETRTDQGDMEKKRVAVERQLKEAIGRVNIRFGTFGNSSEPANAAFGLRITR
jgi:hypothetical protein